MVATEILVSMSTGDERAYGCVKEFLLKENFDIVGQ